ncbi:hypothetical protein J6590_057155 [Homalodisca vitripennis]|nr:hypothetical protein J6590_057155 [Homalodisca vitripennis]
MIDETIRITEHESREHSDVCHCLSHLIPLLAAGAACSGLVWSHGSLPKVQSTLSRPCVSRRQGLLGTRQGNDEQTSSKTRIYQLLLRGSTGQPQPWSSGRAREGQSVNWNQGTSLRPSMLDVDTSIITVSRKKGKL